MLVSLLLACQTSELVVTGGGSATVTLTGPGADEVSEFRVDGVAQGALDEAFQNGTIAEADQGLADLSDTPGFAYLSERQGSYPDLYVQEGSLEGFAPCGEVMNTAWIWLTFSSGSFPDVIFSSDRSDAINEAANYGVMADFEAATGTAEAAPAGSQSFGVTVLCADGRRPATMDVTWELDPAVTASEVEHSTGSLCASPACAEL